MQDIKTKENTHFMSDRRIINVSQRRIYLYNGYYYFTWAQKLSNKCIFEPGTFQSPIAMNANTHYLVE